MIISASTALMDDATGQEITRITPMWATENIAARDELPPQSRLRAGARSGARLRSYRR